MKKLIAIVALALSFSASATSNNCATITTVVESNSRYTAVNVNLDYETAKACVRSGRISMAIGSRGVYVEARGRNTSRLYISNSSRR